MIFDTVGLGYTQRRGEIVVHYPLRDRVSGGVVYGAGFPIGPIPEVYWTSPPNPATAERVALWRELLRERLG